MTASSSPARAAGTPPALPAGRQRSIRRGTAGVPPAVEAAPSPPALALFALFALLLLPACATTTAPRSADPVTTKPFDQAL